MLLASGALVAIYVTAGAALLLLGFWARYGVAGKLLLVALATASWFGVYAALPMLLGWPTDAQIPKRFNLLAVHIEEPSPITGAMGRIYFWGTDRDAGGDTRPRAFRLGFTPELKARFEEARGKLRKGIPQMGETENDEGPFGVPTDESQLGQKSSRLQLHDAPVDLPPTKESPAGSEVAP